MALFSVRFLGCKVSQADATLIKDALIDAGHVESQPERAEVHVVNSCALTVEAERKSRQQVNRAARRGRTYVAGCAVNLNRSQFRAEGVTVVPGSADRAAARIVAAEGAAASPGCRDDAPLAGRTRAFLKVQNGCDSACTFCIIPRTRGAAESRPLADVLREGWRRLGEGHPELVLTGINIGTYRDEQSGADLADLVREVGGLDGLRRLRISSIEPSDVTPRLLCAMDECPTVAPHLHVPLQSGDPHVLAAMGRRYGVDEYRQACVWAREALPAVNLTTDVIVGFPTEGDAAFARTVELVEEIGFGKVHVFPYSPRPGTVAAGMERAVSHEERDARGRVLRQLSERLGRDRLEARVGSTDRVVVETAAPDGTLAGYGGDYSRFTLPPGAGAPGEAIEVVAEAVAGDRLVGRPLP